MSSCQITNKTIEICIESCTINLEWCQMEAIRCSKMVLLFAVCCLLFAAAVCVIISLGVLLMWFRCFAVCMLPVVVVMHLITLWSVEQRCKTKRTVILHLTAFFFFFFIYYNFFLFISCFFSFFFSCLLLCFVVYYC